MRRFYDAVSVRQVDDKWQVTLDNRGLKSVKGTPQLVPTESLARLLAAEWDGQSEKLDPASFVMRDLADYALDVVAPQTSEFAEDLVAYGDTDTLLYRADPDEPLYARQWEIWEPVVAAFEAREGVTMSRASGVIHKAQDAAAMARLKSKLAGLDPFALAGLQALTSLAASLIVGLSALDAEAQADAMSLWNAASLEEDWQADLWGRDQEAEQRRAKRQADFLKAWEFVRASKV